MPRTLLSSLLALILVAVATVASAQSSYRVQPGDTLTVEVLEDPSLNRSTIVLPDGSFSFPFAGTLPAAGQTVPQIQGTIRNAIAGNFASAPTVFVAVAPGERAPVAAVGAAQIDIFMLGELNAPGVVQLDRGATILQAMAIAGGPSRFAATKRIQLRRTDPRSGQQTVSTINYKALSEGAAMNRDIVLQDGDVILVPERRLFE